MGCRGERLWRGTGAWGTQKGHGRVQRGTKGMEEAQKKVQWGTEGALRGAEGVWRVQRPWRGMEGWLPLAKS